MALRTLDLCSGIGGLGAGVSLVLPLRCACYVEREAFPAANLVAAMEAGLLDQAPVWNDLRTFDAQRWRGGLDLLLAGFPCQPHSIAGRKKGEADDRWLWPDVRRIIDETGVPLVFLENVRNLLHSGGEAVVGDLSEMGFRIEAGIYSAREVGAPHIRERLFILAAMGDADRLLQQGRRCGPGSEGIPAEAASGSSRDPALGDPSDRQLLSAERGEVIGAGTEGAGEALAEPSIVGRGARSGDETIGADGDGRNAERCDAAIPDANSNVIRLDEQREARGRVDISDRGETEPEHAGEPLPLWPPLPDDPDGWREYIELGGPEPGVCRGLNGIPDRLDRLRALGNAVVPQQAAFAFADLSSRMIGESYEQPAA